MAERNLLEPSDHALQAIASGTASEEAHRLNLLRERYITDGIAGPGEPLLRALVLNAWHRSRISEVNPDKRRLDTFVPPRLEARVLRAALPVLRRLGGLVSGTHSVVMLTDGQGVVSHVEGERSVRRLLERVQSVPGASLAEEACGANAVGTAIEEGRGVQMWAAEHYIEGFLPFACTAVPIKDPITGRILAVLDITSRAEDLRPLVLQVVQEGARQIMDSLLQEMTRRERALLHYYWEALKRTRKGGVIATNGETTIVSRRAMEFVHAQDYAALLSQAEEALRRGGALEQVITLSTGRPMRLSVEVRYDEGEYVGSLFHIRPVEELAWDTESRRTNVPSLERAPYARPHGPPKRTDSQQQPAGHLAHLVGVTPAFRRAVEVAQQALERDIPVYIWGEPGTGKYALAQAMAAAIGRPAGVIDCTYARAEDWRRAWAEAQVVVLRHVDLLPPRLGPLALDLTGEEGSGPRRIISTGCKRPFARHQRGHKWRLLQRLAGISIEMPPLRQRKEDIPLLAQELLRRHGYDVHLSLEAMRALTRADWPGNVRQLESVLAAAALTARGRDITLADLPRELAESFRGPSLTRWEEAELQALREALRQARGNRRKAAVLLGISRATLYRHIERYRRMGIDVDL